MSGRRANGKHQGEWLELVLDLMPSPLLFVEPDTARVTFANRAAHRMAGGEFPLDGPAEEHEEAFRCTDAGGRRIPRDGMPWARAARGERLRGFQMNWHTPVGVRSLILSSDTIPPLRGQPARAVVSFEDVSALTDAEGRVRRQAEEIARLYREAREAERRKDVSLALLDTLFATAPVGLAFYDRELRYVRINEALAEINGVPPADHVGRTVEEMIPDLARPVLDRLRRVLETGEPLLDDEVVGETAAAPGERRHWLTSYYPVYSGAGDVLGLGVVVHETTERVRLLAAEQAARERAEAAERRWAFLAEAGELLGSSLDYEETLARLTRIVVPAKADWCAVDMLDDDGGVKRIAVLHSEADKARLGWEIQRGWPARLDDAIGPGAVIASGRAEHYPEVPDEVLEAGAHDAGELATLRALGFRSGIVVPLSLHGRSFGALSLIMAESGRRFGADDLELAGELARRAATAVQNARLYRERTRIAHTLQRSLLPPHLPEISGFEVAARYRPAGAGFDVGGDFYDLFETSPGHWSLVIGDVCGKGTDAATLTALARHTVRAAAMQESSPSRVLSLLNEAILREESDDRFCTAAYATLDSRGAPGRAAIACAGHPLPLVLRASGAVETAGCPGTLLGVQRAAELSDAPLALGPGDTLVLYTDGVADAPARDGVLAPDELESIMARAAGLDAESIAERIEQPLLAANAEPARDDAALVVLRRVA